MSWGARDGPEDSGEESDEEPGIGGSGGAGIWGGGNNGAAHPGGGNSNGANSPANDWFAATRHGRDDTVSGGMKFSLNKGPGWEDTYAFKRSTARRAIQTSRILAGKVGGAGRNPASYVCIQETAMEGCPQRHQVASR